MHAYFLENGTRVDIEGCVKAVLASGKYPIHFFDTKTGNVGIIESTKELENLVTRVGESDRYREITKFEEGDYIKIMNEFLDGIIHIMGEEKLYHSLKKIVKDSGYEKTVHALRKDKEGWEHGWNQWLSDEAYELAIDWLMGIPNCKITEKFEGCDDCPACEAMRQGEDGLKELMQMSQKTRPNDK